MAQNEGMAFARLFSQRRSELDLSVVDIAVRTSKPIEVMVAWDTGRAVPDAEDLAKVAETLRLPKPLLKEAVRRVNEYRHTLSAADMPLETGPYPGGESGAEEPTSTGVAVLDDRAPKYSDRARDVASLVLDTVTNMFAELRQSVGRRRRIARAPVDQPSYMEDREQLLTYRLRMVFTVAGVAVLALVLRWSLTGLGAAIADLWDSLSGAL